MRAIAVRLNAEGAPRAKQGRPRGWAHSSVREVLYREAYRGVIVWNKTRKRNARGLERRSVKAPTDRITVMLTFEWAEAMHRCRMVSCLKGKSSP